MPSYETIPAAEDGLLTTAPEPKTSLKRVLGAAALTSFVLGVVAATAVSSAVGPATAQLNTDFDAAYIMPGCNGLDNHVKYMSNPIGSGDAGDGWYCVNYKDEGDAPGGFFISAFNQDSFDTAVDTRSYDPAWIHSGCGRPAWDSWNNYWHCLDDDDFKASMLLPVDFAYQASQEGSVTYGKGDDQWTNSLFNKDGNNGKFYSHAYKGQDGFLWQANWDGQGGKHVQYSAATEGDWYKLWKSDGSATGFYLAELVCPHSYYDKDEYCAIEFRCYYDDSASGFTYTLHDDC